MKHLLIATVWAISSTPLFADMLLTPNEVELKNASETATVFVTHNSKPVLPGDISGITAGVQKTGDAVPETSRDGKHFSNYSYMFDFKVNDDGSVSISPVENTVQAGNYDFYVHTSYGTVTGLIRAHLSESFSTGQRHQLRKPSFTYEIVLPDYRSGQQIAIDLNPDKINTYFWYINGKLHSSGVGQTSFRASPKPGTHEISFVAKDADGDVVSEWSDTTEVKK